MKNAANPEPEADKYVCAPAAHNCDGGVAKAGDAVTFSPEAKGKYGTGYTVTADDKFGCTEGGSTGKPCENFTDCEESKYGCYALVNGALDAEALECQPKDSCGKSAKCPD